MSDDRTARRHLDRGRGARRPRGGAAAGCCARCCASRKAIVGPGHLRDLLRAGAVPQLFTAVREPNRLRVRARRCTPSRAHWLGTTVARARTSGPSWSTAPGSRWSSRWWPASFATVLSVLIGVSAAYLGGIADDVLSMITNVFLVIPTFPLIIVLATYAGKGTLLVILVVLVVTGWSYGANQLRAQTLSLRNRDFLESARVRGERRSYIIVVEVLPTMTSLIVANFLGAALYSVLTAAGLQFLGLGDPNSISWGTMLYWSQNQQALQTGMPLWSIAPGLCVALLGVSFALLNYAFDEISNPALRPVRRRRRANAHRCLRSRDLPVEYATGRRRRCARSTTSTSTSRQGEFVGVVGESGCGKSTLLFAIARLLSPPAEITAGSVAVPRPEPRHDDREAAQRPALARLLGRHAERDERAQPGARPSARSSRTRCARTATRPKREIARAVGRGAASSSASTRSTCAATRTSSAAACGSAR